MADKTETVNFPVTQSINPWVFNIGFNGAEPPSVALGSSKDARLEQVILDAAGSYGRQLGRIGEALGAVLDRLDKLEKLAGENAPPSEDEAKAISDFREQLGLIEAIKKLNR